MRDVQNHLHSLDKLAGNSKVKWRNDANRKEKRDRISQISKKFDTVNQKVADICATAKEKIQEVPVHIKLDVDVPEYALSSGSHLLTLSGVTFTLLHPPCQEINNSNSCTNNNNFLT